MPTSKRVEVADNTSFASVKEVLQRHKAELLARPGVVGVGIGKSESDNPTYVIVVYLRSAQGPAMDPFQLEGVSVQFEVTGDFKAFM
jgi:hypothetical protein